MSGAKLVKRASDVDMESIRRAHTRSISGGIPSATELARSSSSNRAAAEVVEEAEDEKSFSEFWRSNACKQGRAKRRAGRAAMSFESSVLS